MRNLEEIPHEMKPIAPKERFLCLPIPDPEPRTPERPLLLDYSLGHPLEVALDLWGPCSADDLFYFILSEDLVQGNGQVLRGGEITMLFPESLEDSQVG